jgi:hypothetical protein
MAEELACGVDAEGVAGPDGSGGFCEGLDDGTADGVTDVDHADGSDLTVTAPDLERHAGSHPLAGSDVGDNEGEVGLEVDDRCLRKA